MLDKDRKNTSSIDKIKVCPSYLDRQDKYRKERDSVPETGEFFNEFRQHFKVRVIILRYYLFYLSQKWFSDILRIKVFLLVAEALLFEGEARGEQQDNDDGYQEQCYAISAGFCIKACPKTLLNKD